MIESKKKTKKIRLSEEIELKNTSLRKLRKKSTTKTNKVKKLSLIKKVDDLDKKDEPVSFIEQIEKLDKANGIISSKNLKTSFKFTPNNKTICISKIATKNNTITNSVKKINTQQAFNEPKKVAESSLVASKTGSTGLFTRPKNKVKELIEQFGDKFKKAANNLTNKSVAILI